MSALEEVLTRAIARQIGRALPIRGTSSLASDPADSIGIATIKIVTEEQVQAIAYGRLNEEPAVIVRRDPLGRDITDLLPFARFMGEVADRALAREGELRIWVPHSAALETLDVLGHRYWRNQAAPPEIVRMGEVCRIIAHEATFPGQQLVANAADVLRSHVVTGMCPVEEGHLHALLAWMDPAVSDPLSEARQRIRVPASGVLPNTPDQPLDDHIDKLRKEAKYATGTAARAGKVREIETILHQAVLREWRILVEARQAFLSLGLPTAALGGLTNETRKRVKYALESGYFPARSPERLAIQLDQMEAGQDQLEQVTLESDISLREQACRSGTVVRGVITTVNQPQRGRSPCALEIESAQDVVRCRRDDKIKLAGTNVHGVVRRIEASPAGGTRLHIEITSGFRSSGVLATGVHVDVLEQAFGHVRIREFNTVRNRRPWMFYDSVAPVLPQAPSPTQSALAIAQLRRRS